MFTDATGTCTDADTAASLRRPMLHIGAKSVKATLNVIAVPSALFDALAGTC